MRWETEDALRTLTRAKEIQDDKGLMRRVKVMAKEKVKDMSEIAKIRNADHRS